MDFALSDTQRDIKELASKAARQILDPILEEDEEESRFRPDVIQELGKLGLTGIPISTELGGAGLGFREYVTALEEIASVSVAYGVSIGVSGLPQVILSVFGTEAQKKKYIPPIARGEHIGAFSLSESGSGSDAGGIATRAVKKGDKYVINGTKLWTTQGNLAATTIVFARTGAEGNAGLSAFIVEKDTKGFSAAKLEKKMGLHISPTCEMVLEDVEVPAANLVGKEGDGFKIAMTALDCGRITIGSMAVGLARAAFEFATQYAKGRKQFGKPIADMQGIQFMLADMYAGIEASRLLVQRAAFLKDMREPFTREAAAAKFFSTDNAMRVTTDAVQILGGNGYVQEYPVERYMREAKALQIVEGTNQIQRVVIGRSL